MGSAVKSRNFGTGDVMLSFGRTGAGKYSIIQYSVVLQIPLHLSKVDIIIYPSNQHCKLSPSLLESFTQFKFNRRQCY